MFNLKKITLSGSQMLGSKLLQLIFFGETKKQYIEVVIESKLSDVVAVFCFVQFRTKG